jgi:hypothetical protein
MQKNRVPGMGCATPDELLATIFAKLECDKSGCGVKEVNWNRIHQMCQKQYPRPFDRAYINTFLQHVRQCPSIKKLGAERKDYADCVHLAENEMSEDEKLRECGNTLMEMVQKCPDAMMRSTCLLSPEDVQKLRGACTGFEHFPKDRLAWSPISVALQTQSKSDIPHVQNLKRQIQCLFQRLPQDKKGTYNQVNELVQSLPKDVANRTMRFQSLQTQPKQEFLMHFPLDYHVASDLNDWRDVRQFIKELERKEKAIRNDSSFWTRHVTC